HFNCLYSLNYLYPERNPNSSSVFISYIKTSSTSIPLISCFCLIAWLKGSINKENNNGDIGHPCLVPRSSTNELERSPFILIFALGLSYIV
uniref:Uncharacterized protein n=1 Tax=Pygocentrus nattereri TaxID=42514 RepID=A0AAR2KC77_PYGNA